MESFGSRWAAGQRPPPATGSYPTAAQPQPQPQPQPRVEAHTQQTEPEHQLTHRISDISDITDYDYPSAATGSTAEPHNILRGRESLVSLQSTYDPPVNANTTFAPTYTAYNGGGWTATATPTSYGGANAVSGSSSNSHGYYQALGGNGSGSTSTSTTAAPLRRMFSRRNHRMNTDHAPVLEEIDEGRESIDMASLLHSAAPMGTKHDASTTTTSYAPVARQEPEDGGRQGEGMAATAMPFDITGFLGPETSQDAAFVKKLQEQEANGHLTLGLGSGFSPGARIKESDLLSSPTGAGGGGGGEATSPGTAAFSPIPGGSLRRSLSRSWSSAYRSPNADKKSTVTATAHEIQRRNTVRQRAQEEANRRGEVVEIIMEEDEDDDDDDDDDDGNNDNNNSNNNARGLGIHHDLGSKVDLSVVSGTSSMGSRHSTFNIGQRTDTMNSAGGKTNKTQMFYPQPNWKPFSMRWPYLLMLVVLSVGLGLAQEVLYRRTRTQPLLRFHSPEQIPAMMYFAVKYAPTLVAVTFGVLWQVTDFEVKRLEAYYQMTRDEGAMADDSINVDYVTYFAFFRPFRALACRHYAVVLSSVASVLAVSLVPTLGAAAIVLEPDRAAREADPGGEKTMTIHAVWSRMLTATCCVIAVLGCLLFVLLQRRRSGLLSDVKGIAGLASMAVVSHILTDFKDMDVATHQDIHRALGNRRYVLRNSSLAPDDNTAAVLSQDESSSSQNTAGHLPQNPHPLFLRALGCLPLIGGIFAFASLLPVVLFTKANALTDHAAWVVTALAVCIKLGWGGLETAVRLMEPYYQLWRRHAPAKTLTLDYTATPFVWAVVSAVRNRDWLVVLVGIGTVLTELLTVLVTSLATVEGHNFLRPSSSEKKTKRDHSVDMVNNVNNSGQETALSFWVTLGLAEFVLVYMGIVASVVFVCRRRPFLPRQPTTIAAVLAFIHQSKMIWSFVGTNTLGSAAMRKRLVAENHSYGLGWFEGRDGQTHCGVDVEELISSYKPGYDYSRSNQPWNDRPVEWL